MTRQGEQQEIVSRLKDVEEQMKDGLDTEEIRAVLEEMLATMNGNIGAATSEVMAEIQELSDFIEQTRSEIAAINPEEIPDEHIPNATDELDAVIEATEKATNAIFGATETVESVAASLPEEQATQLNDAVTQIYEACSFQDITGQRINKVVTALRDIEEKVETVVQKFGPDPETRERLKAERRAGKESEQSAADAFDEADLLEGPQLPDNANSQDEIDALLADMG